MADYAISNVPRRVVYAASGTGPYAFTFEILSQTDIAVYKASTLLTLTTDYTVTINANGTGSVTLVTSAGTSNITIVGAKNIQRTTDFTTGGDLFANTLNDELDNQTIFIQQVAETAERGLKAPVTDPTDINMNLPAKASRVGTVLAFNATTGNPEVGPSIGSVTTVAAQSANINTVATNIASVNTVSGISSNVTTVAGISGNVTTVAGISANVTSVAGNSSNINTVAGNNANVTTVAGVSGNVTTVAGISANVTTVAGINAAVSTVATNNANVSTVATNIAAVNTNATNIVAIQNASTNATNAATSATNAANSETAAATSATNAAASYDAFDDRYLGSKSSNPTVDNDGNALIAGALYYNTAIPEMRVWNGSSWTFIGSGASAGVESFNTRTGAVTLSSSDVTTALTYTPLAPAAIGTTVQAYDADTTKNDVANTFSANQIISVTDNTNAALRITQLGTGNALLVEDSTNPDSTPFVIDATGNVGIGTASPAANLDVSGTGAQEIRITSNTSGNAKLGFNVVGSAYSSWEVDRATGAMIYADGTERLRIEGQNLKFNSGYGSVATAYGCRAWVNFNGTANTNLTGTYSQTGTTVTVTITAHGYITGSIAYLDFTSGTAVDGAYTVTVTDANTFTVTQASRTTSGNVTSVRSTIRGSGNVSSVSDNGTGDYTVNFTNAMPDANYSISATCGINTSAGSTLGLQNDTQSTTAVSVTARRRDTGATVDQTQCQVAVFR